MYMRNVERNKSDTFVPIDVNKNESTLVSVKFPFLLRNKQLGVCKDGRLTVFGAFVFPLPRTRFFSVD